jgi:hypothetical protein
MLLPARRAPRADDVGTAAVQRLRPAAAATYPPRPNTGSASSTSSSCSPKTGPGYPPPPDHARPIRHLTSYLPSSVLLSPRQRDASTSVIIGRITRLGM